MNKLRLLTLIPLAMIVISSACTDTDSPRILAEETPDSSTSPLIFHHDQTFTTDSFIAAGWKKSKQYDTSTVPEATDIWYGFFDQKDIEIRFYETHESALENGVTVALESLKKDPGARIGGVNTVRTGYSAYAVVGNTVMMCELELSSCETLINALETSASK